MAKDCVWCLKTITKKNKAVGWCDPCCKACAEKVANANITSEYPTMIANIGLLKDAKVIDPKN